MGRVTRGRRSKEAERFVNQFRAGLALGGTLLVLVLGHGPSFAPSLFGSEDSLSTDRRQLVSVAEVAEDDSFFAGMRNRRRLAGDCSGTKPGMGSFDSNGGVVLWVILIIYVFIGIAIICDDYFVEALEEICNVLKIPADVAGATFMAAGSSAPELATVVISTLIEPGDEGLGDVVGAAVFNSMTIVGASAIFAGQTLEITPFPFVRDISFYLLSILMLAIFIGNDEKIELWETILLLLGYAAYITFMYYNVRIANLLKRKAVDEKSGKIVRSMSRRLSQGYLEAALPQFDADGNMVEPEATTGGFSRDKTKSTKQLDLSSIQAEGVAKDLADSIASAGEAKNGHASAPPSPPPSPPMLVSATSVELNPADDSEAIEISVKVKGLDGPVKITGKPAAAAAAATAIIDKSKSGADRMGMKEEDSPMAGRVGLGSPLSTSRTGSSDSAPPSIATTIDALGIDVAMDDEEEKWADLPFLSKVWKVLRFPYWCLFTLTMPDCAKRMMKDRWYIWLFSGSILWIAILTYAMLVLTIRVGCVLNIPGVVMGLVFISAGTTVPDFLSSIIVAKEGQGDMAICNAIGSNIFNIFMGLGFPWFLYIISHGGEAYVTDSLKGNSAIVPICLLFGYVWVLPITLLMTGWKLYAGIGRFLVGMHIAFLVWCLLTACINGAPVLKLNGWEENAGCGDYAGWSPPPPPFFPPSPPFAPPGAPSSRR